MSFLKSVLFGYQGSYNVFGIQVKFENELPPDFIRPNSNLNGAGVISQLAYKFFKSNAFHWITQLHTHVFVHEMGHALSIKALTGQNSEVKIFYKRGGVTQPPAALRYASDWKQTVVEAAGPMADIAFSTCKLVAATALKRYLSWPVALVLGSGAVMWMFGELLYAYVSASKKDDGDFGCIARRGNTHLALASTALVSQCALGIFAAIKFAA
jgi:hypothetical protein